jgi:hypothetical protein
VVHSLNGFGRFGQTWACGAMALSCTVVVVKTDKTAA